MRSAPRGGRLAPNRANRCEIVDVALGGVSWRRTMAEPVAVTLEVAPKVDRPLRWPVSLLFGVALGAGCLPPPPIVRMTPLADNLLWVGGVPAVVKEGKSARVGVAFVQQRDNLASFHVEIENLSTMPIEVGPANFYWAACMRSQDGTKRTCGPSHWVTNPEKVLLDLDIARARQEADAENLQAFAGAFCLLDLAGALGTGAKHAPMAKVAGAVAPIVAMSLDRAQTQAADYQAEQASWEGSALRKTTLPPGGRVTGLVYLTRDTSANEVSLQSRIAGEILELTFAQTLIDTRRPHPTAEQMFPDRDWRGQ